MLIRRAALAACVSVLPAFVAACGADTPAEDPHGVTVSVAPLDLPGIDVACYDLRVASGAGLNVVWAKGDPAFTRLGATQGVVGASPSPANADGATICSDRYGNGRGGDITYVGTCDAEGDVDGNTDNGVQNLVTLWVDGLYRADGTALADWQDPCPGGCSLAVDCVENVDSPVAFDLTIMRRANQGFFDVAVNFEDIFCSAKFDTCYDGDPTKPIELLFGDDVADGPGRDWTGVLGFACTGGPDTATADVSVALKYSHINVSCGATEFALPLAAQTAGKHAVSVAFPGGARDVEYALFYGSEDLLCDGRPCNKIYLNVAVDLEDLPAGCTLSAEASAESSDNPVFTAGAIARAGTTYPYVQFAAIPLDVCAAHGLDKPGSLVKTVYGASPDLVGGYVPKPMCASFDGTTPTAIAADACLPPGRCISQDVVISTQADVANFSACKTVRDIYLDRMQGVTSLVFPDLETVTGYFYFSNNPNLTKVRFPKLKTIGSYFYVDRNAALTEIETSSLESVGSYLYVTNNAVLERLGLSAALTHVQDYVLINRNGGCVPNLAWSSISANVSIGDPLCGP